MVKRTVFVGDYDSVANIKKFDIRVGDFVNSLSENEWPIINYATTMFGLTTGKMDKIRTEILYRECPTRKVITEKNK